MAIDTYVLKTLRLFIGDAVVAVGFSVGNVKSVKRRKKKNEIKKLKILLQNHEFIDSINISD